MHIKDPRLLPEHIKRLIDPAQRKALGILTEEELSLKVEARNERKLHEQIRQFFNRKGIAYLESRMDKRSHATVGWPDFTFAVHLNKPNKIDPTSVTMVPIPCAWECKVGKAKLRPEQEEMFRRLQAFPNSWRVRVIRSLQEAADELKALGV